jgi:hypothetical protein
MLKRIIEQRDVDYVVIYMRSRIFRNYIEAGNVKTTLAKLGVRLISAKEDFGDGLMAEAMEAVTDVFNWLQVRMSGEDIKIKMANKARNGGTIGRAKVGYLNQRILIDGHKVNTVAPDPERAQFIPMAFELFATGTETVASLRGKLTSAGFQGLCDLPFIPVEVLEEAVVRYYGDAVSLPADWLAQIRDGVDEAAKGHQGLGDTLRQQYAKRLDALDRKESYFLDLAAEQGWPKDKLRVKIDAIRSERSQIEDTLAHAEHHLDRGREVFRQALALLEAPHAAYERGDEVVRSILNRAFFARLYVDAGRVIDHEMKEPFNILTEAYRVYQIQQRHSAGVSQRDVTVSEQADTDRESTASSLALAPRGQIWNMTSYVGDTGIEPVTSSV